MKVQSLSVCVPSGCINKCRFCVSHMRRQEGLYKNTIETWGYAYADVVDYAKRLAFARDNGCNIAMLTGEGEPTLNMNFLHYFSDVNSRLQSPFRWIEIQTSGTALDKDKLVGLRREVGVNTISLSVSALDDDINAEYNRTPEKYKVNIKELCRLIKDFDFNLRLSLNLTNALHSFSPVQILERAKCLGADQVTFRVLYTSGKRTEEDEWIKCNQLDPKKVVEIGEYIVKEGKPLEILPYGAVKYSIDGLSVVLDGDCMSTEPKEVMRYLILRPDCRLYSKWDDKASLIF